MTQFHKIENKMFWESRHFLHTECVLDSKIRTINNKIWNHYHRTNSKTGSDIQILGGGDHTNSSSQPPHVRLHVLGCVHLH